MDVGEVEDLQHNSYPYMKTSKGIAVLIGILVIFFIFLLWYIYAVEFCEAVWDIAIRDTVDGIRTGSMIMMAMSLITAIGIGIYFFGGYNAHTILVSDQGIELQRKKGSILITKIENIVERNPNAFRLEGITADGKRIRKMFGVGDMGKDYWPNFKNDVRTLWERQQSGQQPQVPYPPPPPPES